MSKLGFVLKPKYLHQTTQFLTCTSEGTRTPNLIVRTDLLYPLSYGGVQQIILTQTTSKPNI